MAKMLEILLEKESRMWGIKSYRKLREKRLLVTSQTFLSCTNNL